MYIKQIAENSANGTIESNVYLVDGVLDNTPGKENSGNDTLHKIGNLNNGGLQKLLNLANSANSLLLNSAVEDCRDSVAGTSAYGAVYTIRKILEINEIDANIPVENNSTPNHLDILPSLIAGVLNTTLRPDLELRKILDKIHFPFTEGSQKLDLMSFIETKNPIDMNLGIMSQNELSDLRNRCADAEEDYRNLLITAETDFSGFVLAACSRIKNWLKQEYGVWETGRNDGYIFDYALLAASIVHWVESKTFMPWINVDESLSDLQIVRIERESNIILLTTRATSANLNIFYRLNIDPPPMLLGASNFAKQDKENLTNESPDVFVEEEEQLSEESLLKNGVTCI